MEEYDYNNRQYHYRKIEIDKDGMIGFYYIQDAENHAYDRHIRNGGI
jgi:hypothetical protein